MFPRITDKIITKVRTVLDMPATSKDFKAAQEKQQLYKGYAIDRQLADIFLDAIAESGGDTRDFKEGWDFLQVGASEDAI